jgi:putative salt-induced outer membrane protein YdiY
MLKLNAICADLHRLLLRETVQRAETPDQIHGVNADDGAVAEQFTQNAERDAVVRVVERRHDNSGVANVKIRVACRQSLAIKIKWQRHW